MSTHALPVVLVLLLAAACRGDGEDRISRERFIAVNVALRSLPDGATDADRIEVLERYRVRSSDLRRWMAHHEDRPEILAEVWGVVAHRLDSLSNERPTPLDTDVVAGPPTLPPGDEPLPGTDKDSIGPRELAEQLGVPRPPASTGPEPGPGRGGVRIQ